MKPAQWPRQLRHLRQGCPRLSLFAAGRALVALAAVLVPLAVDRACAHGFAGKRFFPATLATEDSFVADELSLPTIASARTGDDPTTLEQSASVDISKRISMNFGIGLARPISGCILRET